MPGSEDGSSFGIDRSERSDSSPTADGFPVRADVRWFRKHPKNASGTEAAARAARAETVVHLSPVINRPVVNGPRP